MKSIIIIALLFISIEVNAQTNQPDTLLRQAGTYGQVAVLLPNIVTAALVPLSFKASSEELVIIYGVIGVAQLVGMIQQYNAWTRVKQYSKEIKK